MPVIRLSEKVAVVIGIGGGAFAWIIESCLQTMKVVFPFQALLNA